MAEDKRRRFKVKGNQQKRCDNMDAAIAGRFNYGTDSPEYPVARPTGGSTRIGATSFSGKTRHRI
jgi:hypothetical protein